MQVTTWGNEFEAPSAFDPANFSMQMQRIAEQVEQELYDLEFWTDHMNSLGGGEVGSPAIMRSRAVDQAGFPVSVEKPVLWDTTQYDNTNTPNTGELILPDQDQRYWWWMGVNLLMAPISANARYTTRLYVQDFDPATGQVLTGVYRYNQYMIASSNQFMMFDGLFRTGGGRMRVTMSHGNTGGAVNLLASSSVWAVRVCPAR